MFDDKLSAELIRTLRAQQQKIVFAESCTAGLISATCGRVPGVSEVLAGSAVVYQIETKATWLEVDRRLLTDPGPVSQIVSESMAAGVLQKTPHANIAVSVTGHLGPDAPDKLDGVAWSTFASESNGKVQLVSKQLHLLPTAAEAAENGMDGTEIRHARQFSAVQQVLRFCLDVLTEDSEPN